ncbi:MAG TPA: phospholipase D-like domain-containing protein [Symbiobacteriaceae bacterium]|jgi:hypothetical protein
MDIGPRPLLAEVYVSDYTPGSGAVYVRLFNPGPNPVDLSGWTLEWSTLPLDFPGGATISGGGSLYVAGDAMAFRQNLTHLPDFALTAFPGVPAMAGNGAPAAALDAARGHVRLLDVRGAFVDALVWGTAPASDGWTGPGAPALDPGLVYLRAIDEASLSPVSTGNFVTPGGTAAAWKQGTAWLPRRQMRVGQGAFPYPTFAANSAVTFTMPDSGFAALQDYLDGARQSLDINIYLFTQDALAVHVQAALQRGVAVRMFLEGQPFEGVPPLMRQNLDQLRQAGAQVRILKGTSGGFKRYHYDHAKYAVVDGHLCLIMSDNWTRTSVPVTAQSGNRGWGVILDSPELAAHLTHVLACDFNPLSPDSVLLDAGVKIPEPVPALTAAELELEPVPLTNPIQPIRMDGPIAVTPMLAPEHALLESPGIAGLIRSATTSLDVQQADLQLFWGYEPTDSMETMPNLYLQELVTAARRGVRLRVLMDGGHLDATNPRDNTFTQKYLQDLAAVEHLDIQVRILDHRATHLSIHNKGVIADESRVLVSSVNWTQNSPLNNREMAVVLNHPAVAAYFGTVFDRDWAGGK